MCNRYATTLFIELRCSSSYAVTDEQMQILQHVVDVELTSLSGRHDVQTSRAAPGGSHLDPFPGLGGMEPGLTWLRVPARGGAPGGRPKLLFLSWRAFHARRVRGPHNWVGVGVLGSRSRLFRSRKCWGSRRRDSVVYKDVRPNGGNAKLGKAPAAARGSPARCLNVRQIWPGRMGVCRVALGRKPALRCNKNTHRRKQRTYFAALPPLPPYSYTFSLGEKSRTYIVGLGI